jgi:structural maintenance of chromosome 1
LRHWYKSGWVSLSLYSGNATDLIARSQDELILHRILYKLFHIEESIERNAREIKARNKTLAGLKEEQKVHEKALEEARKEQAQARSNTMQKEKKVKKAEKAVDAKVSVFNALSYLFLDN